MTETQLLNLYKSLYHASDAMYRELIRHLDALLPTVAEEPPTKPEFDTREHWHEVACRLDKENCRLKDESRVWQRTVDDLRQKIAVKQAALQECSDEANRRKEWADQVEAELLEQKRLLAQEESRYNALHRDRELLGRDYLELCKDKERMDWMDADAQARHSLRNGMTLREHVDKRMADANADLEELCQIGISPENRAVGKAESKWANLEESE